MGRSSLLIILLLFTFSTAVAQINYDFRQVDSITYANTISENWDDVIEVGKYALKNDMDYFYLRLRMGIAYFNQGNYRSATEHLIKASDLNPENGLTKDYMYHAYLYTGQHDEAAYVAGNLNDRMREVSGIDRPEVFSGIYLETGLEISDNLDNHEFEKLPQNQEQRFQDLYGNSFYAHLGFKLQIHPSISLYAGFSNLNISKRAGLQYAWNSPDSIVQHGQGFAKFFPSQPKVETSYYDYTLRQNGAYLKANIQLGQNWSITPAAHYVHVNTKSIGIDNNSRIVKDTANYIPVLDTVVYMYYDLLQFGLNPQTLKLNNYVVSLALKKKIFAFDLGIFGSWSNLNNLTQYQYGVSISYFPFGNLNFYGNTIFKGLTEEKETRPVFSQMLGAKITHFLWLEAFGTFGNLRGTNESDAFIVYNISDEFHLKTGINLTFVISPAVQLSVRYQYLQKQGYRTIRGPNIPRGIRIEELDYNNHSIIGGLKWSL